MYRFSDKKNSLWLSIQFIVVLITSFITLKVNLINFGNKAFGLWILFSSIWGLSSVIDLGFGTAMVKHISSAASEENDNREVNTIASTGIILFILLGISILIIGNLLAEAFIFNTSLVSDSGVLNAKIVFLIIGFSFFLRYLVSFIISVFEGLSNFVSGSQINIYYNIILLFSTIFIYINHLSLLHLSYAYFSLSGFQLLVCFVVLHRKYPGIILKYKSCKLSTAKKMFGFSLSVQITSLLGAAIDPAIKYIIGRYDSLNTLSYYEIARKFALALSGLFQTAFRNILAKVSVLQNREQYYNFIITEGMPLSRIGIGYAGIFFGILSTGFALIIKSWFGYNEAIDIFLILSLVESFNVVGFFPFIFIMGIGKAQYNALVQGYNLLVTMGFIICGYYIFHSYAGLLGYSGAILTGNILLTVTMKKVSGIGLLEYLKGIYAYKIIIVNIITLLIIIVEYYYHFSLFLSLAILSIASILLFRQELKISFRVLKNEIYLFLSR